MPRRSIVLVVGIFVLFLLAFESSFSSGSVQIDWWTVDAGGGLMTNGASYLHGTVGQPDPQLMVNQSYQLEGGFWTFSEATVKYSLYVPLTQK